MYSNKLFMASKNVLIYFIILLLLIAPMLTTLAVEGVSYEPMMMDQSTLIEAEEGEEVIFYVVMDTPPRGITLGYTWLFNSYRPDTNEYDVPVVNGKYIKGADSSSITVTAMPETEGEYVCIVRAYYQDEEVGIQVIDPMQLVLLKQEETEEIEEIEKPGDSEGLPPGTAVYYDPMYLDKSDDFYVDKNVRIHMFVKMEDPPEGIRLEYEWHFMPTYIGQGDYLIRDSDKISGAKTDKLSVLTSDSTDGSYYCVVRAVWQNEIVGMDVIDPIMVFVKDAQEIKADKPEAKVPGMPNVSLQSSNDSISASWLHVDNGGSIVLAYYCQLDNNTPELVFFTPTGANVITFRNLTPDTQYTVSVWAENAVGQGPHSVKTIKTTSYGVTPKPGPPAIEREPMNFGDVPVNTWYYEDVKIAYEKGLIDGKSASEYKPNDNITYAEAVKLAACMHQLYNHGSVTLKNGTKYWYSTYAEYAIENGIMTENEWDNGKKASEKITRSEFVNLFYNALPIKEYASVNVVFNDRIPDVKSSDRHANKIYTFYRAGILTGSDLAGTFKPNDFIKRSEVAAILTRMFDNTARRSITLK